MPVSNVLQVDRWRDSKKPVIRCRHSKPITVIAAHKMNPATNARRQGREATIPTNCRLVQSDRTATHMPSHPLMAGVFGRGRRCQNMERPSSQEAYVSMTSLLSPRDNGDGETAMWWHLQYRCRPRDGILQISDAETARLWATMGKHGSWLLDQRERQGAENLIGRRGKPSAGSSLSARLARDHRDVRLWPVLAGIADLQVLGPCRDLPISLF